MKIRFFLRFPAALCASVFCAAPNFAQTPAAPPLPFPSQAPLPTTLAPLSIEAIMRGPELWGTKPESVVWSLDSSRVYFRWKEPTAPRLVPMSWYVVLRDAKTTAPRKMTDDEARNEITPLLNGETTHDGKRLVFAQNNDLWLMEAGVLGKRQITQTPADIKSNPRWTKDEKRITYRRGDNLYIMSAPPAASSANAKSAVFPIAVQITNILSASPPSDGIVSRRGENGVNGAAINRQKDGEAEAQTERQRELFWVLRDRAAQEDAAKAETEAAKKAEAKRGPKAWTPAPNQSVADLSLAPDETQVLMEINERPAPNSPFTPQPTSLVPEWINQTGRVSAQNGRTTVGQTSVFDRSTTRFALMNAASGMVVYLAPPENLKDRILRFDGAEWSNDGKSLVVSARATDNHDRFLFLADRTTGKTILLHDAHDDAWIGGPGAFSWGWMPDNQAVWFVSEAGTGWAHLATVSLNGGQETPLMTGAFEVFAPTLNHAKTDWFFTSSENNAGERHLWTMPVQGGNGGTATRKQITRQPGLENATLSPDEKTLAVISSYVNRPPEVFLQNNKANAESRRVTVSPTPLFLTYPWRDVPTVTFPARDGAMVSARLFTPTIKPSQGGSPAVVFVHGAGYLQNAHRGWSQYEHEFLFHHFLADRGYTVLDVDYRGSSGYGRNVRTAIYKHMGGADLNDAEDGAKWLVQTQDVDAKRIGIYGGSYGGFLTLMALFTQPDTWACGAALRPVSDWSQYNAPYTAPILGLPQTDYAPYRLSSPIYYAQGLRGGLLICHGMEDSNVFFSDTVRLTQRLIELGKTNWDVAMYPVENHTFTEAASWTDEFKRIFALFEKYLGAYPPQ